MILIRSDNQELSKTARFIGVAAMVVEKSQHWEWWSRLEIICLPGSLG